MSELWPEICSTSAVRVVQVWFVHFDFAATGAGENACGGRWRTPNIAKGASVRDDITHRLASETLDVHLPYLRAMESANMRYRSWRGGIADDSGLTLFILPTFRLFPCCLLFWLVSVKVDTLVDIRSRQGDFLFLANGPKVGTNMLTSCYLFSIGNGKHTTVAETR